MIEAVWAVRLARVSNECKCDGDSTPHVSGEDCPIDRLVPCHIDLSGIESEKVAYYPDTGLFPPRAAVSTIMPFDSIIPDELKKRLWHAGLDTCPKLPTFSGIHDSNNCDDFLTRFDTIANLCCWTAGQ